MTIKRTSQKYQVAGNALMTVAKLITKWSRNCTLGSIVTTQAQLKIEAQELKNENESLKTAQHSNKIVQGDLDIEERKLKIEERRLKIEAKKRELGITTSPFVAAGYEEPGNIREENRGK